MFMLLIVLTDQGGAFSDNATDARNCVDQCDVSMNCVSVTVSIEPRNRD